MEEHAIGASVTEACISFPYSTKSKGRTSTRHCGKSGYLLPLSLNNLFQICASLMPQEQEFDLVFALILEFLPQMGNQNQANDENVPGGRESG